MSDKEHHCALVAGGENDFHPLLVVRRTASAIVAAVRSHFQHFSARLVADIHALAVPGWKQRPAELCPDMIADVTGRWQQEEATFDPGSRFLNRPIEIHGGRDH
jgi:hypothetical protein